MYRIIFDTTVSKFIVQLQCLIFFWNTCQVQDTDGKQCDIRFNDYSQAEAWVNSVGLNKAYAMKRTPREFHEHMNPGTRGFA